MIRFPQRNTHLSWLWMRRGNGIKHCISFHDHFKSIVVIPKDHHNWEKNMKNVNNNNIVEVSKRDVVEDNIKRDSGKVHWRDRKPKYFWLLFGAAASLFAGEIYSYYTIRTKLDEILELLTVDKSKEKRLQNNSMPLQLVLEQEASGNANDLEKYIVRMHNGLELLRNMAIKNYMIQLLKEKDDIVISKLLDILEQSTNDEIRQSAAHILFILSRYETLAKTIIQENGIDRIYNDLLSYIFDKKYNMIHRERLIERVSRLFIKIFDHKTINEEISKDPHCLSLLIQMTQFNNPEWLSKTGIECIANLCKNHVLFMKSLSKNEYDKYRHILLSSNSRFISGLEFLAEHCKNERIKQKAAELLELMEQYSGPDALGERGTSKSLVSRYYEVIEKDFGFRDYLATGIYLMLIPFTVAYMAKCYSRIGAPNEVFFQKVKLVVSTFLFTDYVLAPIRYIYFSANSPLCRDNLAIEKNSFEGWALFTLFIYSLHLFVWYHCPYINMAYIFRLLPIVTVDTHSGEFDGVNRIPYFTFIKLKAVQKDLRTKSGHDM